MCRWRHEMDANVTIASNHFRLQQLIPVFLSWSLLRPKEANCKTFGWILHCCDCYFLLEEQDVSRDTYQWQIVMQQFETQVDQLKIELLQDTVLQVDELIFLGLETSAWGLGLIEWTSEGKSFYFQSFNFLLLVTSVMSTQKLLRVTYLPLWQLLLHVLLLSHITIQTWAHICSLYALKQ